MKTHEPCTKADLLTGAPCVATGAHRRHHDIDGARWWTDNRGRWHRVPPHAGRARSAAPPPGTQARHEATISLGGLTIPIGAPRRRCGLHGDDTTSGRCATCDASQEGITR